MPSQQRKTGHRPGQPAMIRRPYRPAVYADSCRPTSSPSAAAAVAERTVLAVGVDGHQNLPSDGHKASAMAITKSHQDR